MARGPIGMLAALVVASSVFVGPVAAQMGGDPIIGVW